MTESADDEPLPGGWQTEVHRQGDTVLRSASPHSPYVLALLTHLANTGAPWSPRPVGDGIAADGREHLTFMPGKSPHPGAWSDDAIEQLGTMLRALHDATASFHPPPGVSPRPWFGRAMTGANPVIGHGDLGPWNVLAIDGDPTAFIDWDNAGPVDRAVELAQVVWLNCQLHDDDVAELNGLPDAAARIAQARVLLDAYGLARRERRGVVDLMIEFAIRSARAEAIDHDVTVTTVSPAPDGFPIAWAIAWRTRSAAWMFDHRTDLVQAIEGSAGS